MRRSEKERRSLAALLLVSVLVSACGGSAASHKAGRGSRSGRSGTGASCAVRSSRQEFAAARVVFDGRMLPGRTVGVGSERFLASPARVLVTRYLKGNGPRLVEVQTAVTPRPGGLVVNEDGIQPGAGQRWRIYSAGVRPPLSTSLCAGSRPLGVGLRTFRTARISFTYPADWHVGRYHAKTSFVSVIAFLSPQRMHRPCSVRRGRRRTTARCRNPLSHLRRNSILVSWSRWTTRGWTLRGNPGRVTHIAGRRAKLGVARKTCGVGASRLIAAAIPIPGSPGARYAMFACLRGPALGELTGQVRAMLGSVHLRSGHRTVRRKHARRPGRSRHRVRAHRHHRG